MTEQLLPQAGEAEEPNPEVAAIADNPDPDEAGDGTFSVGPPDAIFDSRLLPAVTADDEAALVATTADPLDDVDEPPDVPVPPADDDADQELPGDDELDALISDVDTDSVETGFDASMLQDASEGGA